MTKIDLNKDAMWLSGWLSLKFQCTIYLYGENNTRPSAAERITNEKCCSVQQMQAEVLAAACRCGNPAFFPAV